MDSLSSPFVSAFVYFMDFYYEKNRNFGYFLVYFFCAILNLISILDLQNIYPFKYFGREADYIVKK